MYMRRSLPSLAPRHTTTMDDVQDLQVSRKTGMSEATGGSADIASLHGRNLLG